MSGGDTPAYRRPIGNGFILYAEFKRPADLRPIATSTFNQNIDALPDFQIVSDRPLGDGSAAVCDAGPAPNLPTGGVPAVAGGNFESNPQAVNDFSCRFDVRTGGSSGPCTRNGSGSDVFASNQTEVQFCAIVGAEIAFPLGDTRLTVRVRDQLGRPGPPMSILVRVLGD